MEFEMDTNMNNMMNLKDPLSRFSDTLRHRVRVARRACED